MKNLFRIETNQNKMELLIKDFFVACSWMSLWRGEGEEEIESHGRSRVKSFSQETGAISQWTPRSGANGPKLKSLKCRMHDDTRTQLPFFSRSELVNRTSRVLKQKVMVQNG